jgi:GT2 family glycosyltransferase
MHEASRDRLTVSVVIPTRNRPERLAAVVGHLLAQTAAIDELIVVDQSEGRSGQDVVEGLLDQVPTGRRPALVYQWDRAIDGAAAARNRGFDLARSVVVLCVDDDMVPAPDVIERLLAHYARHPALVAITPVITNYPPPPLGQRWFLEVFCRGPFRDDRQPVYWHWRRHRSPLVNVRMLGGGMLSVRRDALGGLRFDPRYRGASLGEDIDLSWSLAARGARLAIATDAHVVHDRAPRPRARLEEALLTSWGFVYHKHQPKTLANRVAFVWFVTGVVGVATLAALYTRSLAPLRSAAAGVRNLVSDYAGSSFLKPRAPGLRDQPTETVRQGGAHGPL